MPTLNELHSRYAADPTGAHMNEMLASVRAQAVRHARIKGGMEAEDIAQDVCLVVYLTTHNYKPKEQGGSSFSSWVWTITNGIIKDRYQKERRRPCLVASENGPVEQFLAPNDLVANLILEGYSVVAIAEKLNTTRSSIRFHLKKLGEQQPK